MKEIESKFRVFLWTGANDKSTKALVSWRQICLPKVSGGWNILSLPYWNKAAVTRILWDLAHKSDNMWVRWVHTYYFKKLDWWNDFHPKSCSWVLKKVLKSRKIIDEVGGWSTVQHRGIFSIQKLYNQIRPQGKKVQWRRAICNNKAIPKSVFILWLAIQDRLTTKERLVKWHMNVDPICVLCNKEEETLKHLFFECDYSRQVWKMILDNLGFYPNCYKMEEVLKITYKCGKKKTPKAKLFTMCLSEAVYGIWLERNNKIFNNNCMNVMILYRQIIFRVACRTNDSERVMLIH